MKRFSLGVCLALFCFFVGAAGCRKKQVETPAATVPPVVAAPSGAAPVERQPPIPGLPASAQPKTGEALPPVTTEMMLKFEAKFGRPPSNYNELSRLKN